MKLLEDVLEVILLEHLDRPLKLPVKPWKLQLNPSVSRRAFTSLSERRRCGWLFSTRRLCGCQSCQSSGSEASWQAVHRYQRAHHVISTAQNNKASRLCIPFLFQPARTYSAQRWSMNGGFSGVPAPTASPFTAASVSLCVSFMSYSRKLCQLVSKATAVNNTPPLFLKYIASNWPPNKWPAK